jgi:predicted DNA-binding protein (MmcQ/YjbR family)
LWASVWIDGTVDWKSIESVLECSYRLVANKRLLTLLDAMRKNG